MRLKPIYESILRELGEEEFQQDPNIQQDPNVQQQDPNVPMEQPPVEDPAAEQPADEGDIIEFPNDNFTLSVFRPQKKLLFSPQFHSSMTKKVRSLVNMLKQQFRVLRVNAKDMGAFEVEFDPREDMESAIDFVRKQAEEG